MQQAASYTSLAGLICVIGRLHKGLSPSSSCHGEVCRVSAPIMAELTSCSPIMWGSHSWADALAVAWQGKVAHYVFVGSAGAYNADPIEPMHFEGDKRKSSAGHVAVENYLADQARYPGGTMQSQAVLCLK